MTTPTTVFKSGDGYVQATEYQSPGSNGVGSGALPSMVGSAFPSFSSDAPAVSDKPNIFQTIMNAESGGRNVNNYMFDGAHTASGYFQITDSTWLSTNAGKASGFTHAMDADYATQQNVASELISRNGLKDWAPYDHIDGDVSHYDMSQLSGPSGKGYAQQPASTQQNGSFSSGAASGDDSVLNPATVPLAITSSQKAADTTSTKNTKSATDAFTGGVKSITDTTKAAYAAAHDALGDTLFRIALIAIGAILLLGGLWIIAAEQGVAPSPRKTLKTLGKAALVA